MKSVLEMFDVDMKVGDTVKVKIFIDPDAERFAISMGKDNSELALHFNPRFDDDQDGQVIVFNNKEDGEWCTEQREDTFTFEKGEYFKFSITFLGVKFEIKLPDYVMEFPNRSSMDTITFLAVQGDVRVKSVKFDY
ncbi:lectin, galactoside-binding, soluble, 2b [Carcharodon carcharias]|uniref:lectin, galactoside-binding, soluble, 2b n=1 Tax=Carcharodon carcharias TaxID=13397 RepID=UPI001B7EB4C4|nr:lectin, galactoside-binding, soluble, 2b [Carcharodon carcharias]